MNVARIRLWSSHHGWPGWIRIRGGDADTELTADTDTRRERRRRQNALESHYAAPLITDAADLAP
jgi:hypothetical protein